MKLFTKIFLQVAAGFIILSFITFGYFLKESQRQALSDREQAEYLTFTSKLSEFSKKMTQYKPYLNDETIQDMVAIENFRDFFGSQGGLYKNGESLCNYSPYEFDYQKTKEANQNKDSAYGEGKEWFLEELDGRKILLYFSEISGNQNEKYGIFYYRDVTDIFERTENLFLKGLGFSAIAILIVGGILLQGIYRTLRPLINLKKAAASIAEGSYHIRVPVKGKDEIGELTVSFNRMAEKVEEHVEKLSQTNELQRQLLGSLAHELKTPMTAIIGYADTLLTVRLSDKRREQALNYIGNECRRLSRLSVKMLELTGLYETGESIALKEESVERLFKDLSDLTKYRLEKKQIELQCVCTPEKLTKKMDRDLMMSLLMNLVDNAFKASGEGSVITVLGREEGITVEDPGKGIPEDEIERVTEAFYMVDKSRARSAGSVGLGLALCKQIAAIHGGTLRVESREGKGTRVSVLW